MGLECVWSGWLKEFYGGRLFEVGMIVIGQKVRMGMCVPRCIRIFFFLQRKV